MPIPSTVNDRELLKFKESTATPGVPAVAIVNPDGTNVGGAGGTSMTDDSAFAVGASSLTPAGFLADDVAPDPVDEGDVGAARMRRTTRTLYVEPVDQSGDSVGDDANNALRVNVVAGGAGGGNADTRVRNAGDTAFENVGPAAANAKMPARLFDAGANPAAVLNVAPSTEYGLITRNIPSGTQPVSGPLTDTQLRATAVPISAASLPLPAGAATEATLDARTGARGQWE